MQICMGLVYSFIHILNVKFIDDTRGGKTELLIRYKGVRDRDYLQKHYRSKSTGDNRVTETRL